MLSGRPRIIPPASGDPISALNSGKSQARLATPVRLPLERTLPGPISDWMLLTASGEWCHEYLLNVQQLDQKGFHYTARDIRPCTGMKTWWMLANRHTGQGLAYMQAFMGNWTMSIEPNGQEIKVRVATLPGDIEPYLTLAGLPVPGALVADFTGHWDYGAQPIARFVREKTVAQDSGAMAAGEL